MRLLNEATAYRNSNELLSMLIDNYSNELDSYKFDSIITDMSSPKNKFIDKLCILIKLALFIQLLKRN